MQIIKELSERIEEELEGAEDYVKKAIQYQHFDANVADMYYQMSIDEMKHTNMLHDQGVRLIKKYEEEGNMIPDPMREMYNYLHEKHIEKANSIMVFQKQYKP